MSFPRPLHVNASANVAAYGGTVHVIDTMIEGTRPTSFTRASTPDAISLQGPIRVRRAPSTS
jgi:hypothetical protein